MINILWHTLKHKITESVSLLNGVVIPLSPVVVSLQDIHRDHKSWLTPIVKNVFRCPFCKGPVNQHILPQGEYLFQCRDCCAKSTPGSNLVNGTYGTFRGLMTKMVFRGKGNSTFPGRSELLLKSQDFVYPNSFDSNFVIVIGKLRELIDWVEWEGSSNDRRYHRCGREFCRKLFPLVRELIGLLMNREKLRNSVDWVKHFQSG